MYNVAAEEYVSCRKIFVPPLLFIRSFYTRHFYFHFQQPQAVVAAAGPNDYSCVHAYRLYINIYLIYNFISITGFFQQTPLHLKNSRDEKYLNCITNAPMELQSCLRVQTKKRKYVSMDTCIIHTSF